MSARLATPAPATLDRTFEGRPAAASVADSLLGALAQRLWPFALIAAVALLSRARYIWGGHDTFGSGDANLVLTKALLIEHGDFAPPGSLGVVSAVFAIPPFIPLLFAAFAKATPLALHDVPVILGPIVTIAALFALFGVLCRAFDRTIAVIATVAVALLPRYAFDSTEPDKVAYVVAFFAIALFFLYEGQRRPWMLLFAGLCMGLALFSHTTALLFIPVYLGSHIALSRGDLRKTLSPYFLGSCAVALVFFSAYLALDRMYEPSAGPVLSLPAAAAPAPVDATPAAPSPLAPDTLAPPDDGNSIVPGTIRQYWLNVRGLAEDGFRDSAWDRYFDGIRSQVLDPVFLLAIGGFILGAWLAIARRRLEIVPLLLWMSVVTVGFAIQHPAPSHASRYPSYVTPVFVVMAVFFVIWVGREIARRLSWEPAYAYVLAAPVLAWVAFSYATAPEQGLRKLYEPHGDLAAYVNQQQLLSDDSRLLYLGWPSYTYALLEGGAEQDTLQSFGWQRMDFERYDFEGQRTRYYAFDDFNEDYFQSAHKMMGALATNYELREVTTFCISPSTVEGQQTCVGNVHLVELLEKKTAAP